MDMDTRQHIMDLDEPETLREHMLAAHSPSMPAAMLVRNADHQELDEYHITAHRGGTLDQPPVEGLKDLLRF